MLETSAQLLMVLRYWSQEGSSWLGVPAAHAGLVHCGAHQRVIRPVPSHSAKSFAAISALQDFSLELIHLIQALQTRLPGAQLETEPEPPLCTDLHSCFQRSPSASPAAGPPGSECGLLSGSASP